MTSLTRGLNGHSRRSLKPSVVNKVMSLRKQGMTCDQIAEVTGVGSSTVARYTSDWFQANVQKRNLKPRGSKRSSEREQQRRAKIAQRVEKKIQVATQKPHKQDGLQPLAPEVIRYIQSIYESHRTASGNPIGNFLIRIGKALGGNHPV